MARIKHPSKLDDIGFQIAPMIDVVFVIMLFFMVKMAGRQTEMALTTKLPSAETPHRVEGLESLEETIQIDEAGSISHNDDVLDAADSLKGDLQLLKDRMKRLAEQSKADKTPVLVTVSANPDTKYRRVVEVLNVLEVAGLRNVTFDAGSSY